MNDLQATTARNVDLHSLGQRINEYHIRAAEHAAKISKNYDLFLQA